MLGSIETGESMFNMLHDTLCTFGYPESQKSNFWKIVVPSLPNADNQPHAQTDSIYARYNGTHADLLPCPSRIHE